MSDEPVIHFRESAVTFMCGKQAEKDDVWAQDQTEVTCPGCKSGIARKNAMSLPPPYE